MGQQQLLLTILVTILVGIAIVVALNLMHDQRTEMNKTAVRQDIIMIMNDAQTYYRKPKLMGGGGRSFNGFNTSKVLSVDTSSANGSYTISGSGKTLTVDGEGSASDVDITATATMTQDGMEIEWSGVN